MIAPPGGATQTVQYAPSREILDSKRIPLMEDQEVRHRERERERERVEQRDFRMAERRIL